MRMVRLLAIGLALAPIAAHAAPATWVRSWAASPMEMPSPPPNAPVPPNLVSLGSDVTIRMVARLSAGGSAVRLRLSNEYSAAPLPLGVVHVALADASGSPVPGSDRAVTFDGAERPTIAPFAPLVSDPVTLNVPPLSKLLVSIHVPGDASKLTVHALGLTSSLIAPGDQTAVASFPADARRITMRYVLSGIDVSGGSATGTIVTIGDSITDGAQSTRETDRRWPDVLAERLGPKSRFAVANEGISGNRLLLTGSGPAALARLDRDVLAVPGVKYLVVLEGINDIGTTARAKQPAPAPATIITAYRQMIDRAHEKGIKVIGATVLPYKGAGYYAEDGDATRRAVNDWIRAPGHFDGVIDFDRAVADPADPLRMAKAYDSGDALHPGDAGYRHMGEAIDLKLFK